MTEAAIIYPDEFKPSNCPVFVRNEISIHASEDDIWYWLTNATTWPEWYRNSSNVQILNQKDNHLLAGSTFKWRTFRTNIICEIKEHIPNHRLAWEARTTGLRAYHAWLIIPTKDGCQVITEETQKGWLSWLGKLLTPNQMYNQHQKWLEGLKKKAEEKQG